VDQNFSAQKMKALPPIFCGEGTRKPRSRQGAWLPAETKTLAQRFCNDRSRLMLPLFLLLLVIQLLFLLSVSSSKVEAKRSSSSSSIGDELSLSLSGSSSFFKRSRHNYYYTQPPHDTKLYDTLGIPPNATLLDVQKAHRKRSLLYHPDKIPPSQASEAKHKLDKISHAYAILNNDQSRLLYHRYGIIDGNEEYILRLLLLGNNAAGNYDQGGRGGDASSLSSSHSSSVIGVDDDEITLYWSGISN
jgi:hypothetical protein